MERNNGSAARHGDPGNADIPAVFWTTFTGVVLGGLGITVVLCAT